MSIPNLISTLLFTLHVYFGNFDFCICIVGDFFFFLIKKKQDFMLAMFFNKLTRTPHSSGFSICYRVILVRKLGHINREI